MNWRNSLSPLPRLAPYICYATNKLQTGTYILYHLTCTISLFLTFCDTLLWKAWVFLRGAQRQITRGESNPVTSGLDWIAITHRWICSEIRKRSVRLKLPFHRRNLNQPRKVNLWKVGIIMEFPTPKATHFDHRLRSATIRNARHHWSPISRHRYSAGKHIKHEKITEQWSFVVGIRFVYGERCYWSEAISVLLLGGTNVSKLSFTVIAFHACEISQA